MTPQTLLRTLMLALTFLALTPAMTGAATIWSESFTGVAHGSAPSTDYNADTDNDWTLTSSSAGSSATISTSTGNPSPSLYIADTDGTGVNASVSMNEFADFNTAVGGDGIRISFDWRVDAWAASATNSNARFWLRDGGTTRFTMGFGRSNIADGDGNTDLFFFATTSTTGNPSSSNAIGFNGTGWDEGFDFGNYDSVTAANNNTGGDFIRVEIVYFDQATSADITLINGANSTTYTITGLTPSSFSNTGGDSFLFSAPGSGTGEFCFDNIFVEQIPEPASPLLLGFAAACGILMRRTRRRRHS